MTEFSSHMSFDCAATHRSMGDYSSRRVSEKSERFLLGGKAMSFSHSTVGTETTSFSEDGDENDMVYEPFSTGVFRIDDLYSEEDSTSNAAIRTSLIDGENSLEFIAEGLPREIIILDDDALESADDADIHQRLKIAETLVRTYRAKMQSTENLTDSLHDYLRHAQTYAEDVLADREELLREIEHMQEEEQARMDRLMLFKLIMACSLCYYACGGSPAFLIYSVGLYLVADTLNSFV